MKTDHELRAEPDRGPNRRSFEPNRHANGEGEAPWLDDAPPFDPDDGPPPGSPGQGTADNKQPFRFFKFPWEFEKAKAPTLVKGLMAHGDEVLVYGPPEAGKTFFLIDLAGRWACGEPWRGRNVERGLVVYLAGERKISVQNRICAWAIRNGKRLEDLPVLVLDKPLNLLRPDNGDLAIVAEEIQAAAKSIGLPVAAIVSDTVHSLSPGSKEDAHSFGILLDQVRRLRDAIAQPDPIALVYCHHTGKDEDRGPRGGNALPAGMSLSMSISVRLEKYRLVEVDKNSDLAERPHIEPFIIEDVTIGRTADNLPIKFGVHVAIPITEVPNPPEGELRTRAVKMHREGKAYRSIAKAVGRSVGTIHNWLEGEPKRSKQETNR